MVVTDNGEVYGWGDNEMGQLGLGKNNSNNFGNKRGPCQVTAVIGVVIGRVIIFLHWYKL